MQLCNTLCSDTVSTYTAMLQTASTTPARCMLLHEHNCWPMRCLPAGLTCGGWGCVTSGSAGTLPLCSAAHTNRIVVRSRSSRQAVRAARSVMCQMRRLWLLSPPYCACRFTESRLHFHGHAHPVCTVHLAGQPAAELLQAA